MNVRPILRRILLLLLASCCSGLMAESSRRLIDAQPMATITTEGVKIAYQLLGPEDADTAVLVMGLGASHRVWGDDFVLGIIDAGYRVLLIDNRDTGDSIRYSEAENPVLWWQLLKYELGFGVTALYELSDMGSDVIDVMDALSIGKAHLIGASMGGMIAQVIAVEHPERVQTLVSIMSSTWADHLPEPGRQSTAAIRDIADDGAKDTERAAKMKNMGFHAEAIPRQVMAILAAGDRSEAVRMIKAPTLVIHGQDDTLLSVEHGEHTAEMIANSKLVVFEGMGHNMPDTVRPAILKEIGAHLDAHPAAASANDAKLESGLGV
ncbi:MAG: alpha/beta fold hydrolase [Pseudomonadales bacterium]